MVIVSLGAQAVTVLQDDTVGRTYESAPTVKVSVVPTHNIVRVRGKWLS